jgi:flagellar assembly factor FliW
MVIYAATFDEYKLEIETKLKKKLKKSKNKDKMIFETVRDKMRVGMA